MFRQGDVMSTQICECDGSNSQKQLPSFTATPQGLFNIQADNYLDGQKITQDRTVWV